MMICFDNIKMLLLFALSIVGMMYMVPVSAQNSSYQPTLPRLALPEQEDSSKLAQPVELRNVPDFPTAVLGIEISHSAGEAAQKRGTALQGEAASTTLPVKTRMKLVLETRVDAKASKPGDVFEGHVRDDLFVGTNLLLPRGSLIRGRIAVVNKPRMISRAARIGLKLDQIVTPTGEVIPLDAALEFEKGVANEKGQLDPGTSFSTRVGSQIRAVSGIGAVGAAKGALVAANVATLGVPTIATAIGGSAIALFRSGDNVNLGPGQEIEIILTDNLGLQIN